MLYIETTTTLRKTVFRTKVWKCYMHDLFSLWDMSKWDIEAFIEQANLLHPTIKFTAETFDTETAFLATVVYNATGFKEKSQSLMQRHILNKHKPCCTHISPRVTLRVLKKDLSKEKPWESYEKTPQKQPLRKIIQIKKKEKPLMDGGYPQTLIENLPSEIKFTKGSLNSWNKTIRRKKKYCHSWHNTNPKCLL